MPIVRFTQNIQRHLACPAREVAGATVRDALHDYFPSHERARGYVLDDQGRLRQHMAIFIHGAQIWDPDKLSDPVSADAVIDLGLPRPVTAPPAAWRGGRCGPPSG